METRAPSSWRKTPAGGTSAGTGLSAPARRYPPSDARIVPRLAALQRIDRDIFFSIYRPERNDIANRRIWRQPVTAQTKDKPWLIRTYAGHSTAKASNALYRGNLAKGQTGLSVAFDLPTQTGYDSDHELARGEVGKVGVPISHLGDMRTLFDEIPLEQMNTSMTINATAPWLLALYIAVAEEQGADVAKLQGTVQNDLMKEYLSRGTYICPPKPSLEDDRGRGGVLLYQRSEMEPDERVFLPPAGGRRDAGAGTGLRAGNGDRGAGRIAPAKCRRRISRFSSGASRSS
jgi:hypothetical protein